MTPDERKQAATMVGIFAETGARPVGGPRLDRRGRPTPQGDGLVTAAVALHTDPTGATVVLESRA